MQRDTVDRSCSVTARQAASCPLSAVCCLLLLATCSPRQEQDAPEAKAVYGKAGVLEQIQVDRDRNGVVDTWSYMSGSRIVRIEVDQDEDGKVERWEYYGEDEALEKVGYSRARDGRVDAWAWQGPDGKVARVEISTRRDGKVTRTEAYEGGVLARAEEDADGNGLVDQWETYAAGRLTSVEFDRTGDGRPDNRLVYEPGGKVRAEGVASPR